MKEISDSKDVLGSAQILIHENAVVLSEKHAHIEQEVMQGISSTMQGSAAAMVQKIWRNAGNNPCVGENNDIRLMRHNIDILTADTWNYVIASEVNNGMLEGAQGYSLGINSGFYPYCTSRDCTPARFLADCQLPLTSVRKVIGTARTYPIRVGSLSGTTSGGHYSDQEETTWEELGLNKETTTVTGRTRRVFTFSKAQMGQAIMVCQPDEIFLNFCNYNKPYAGLVKRQINSLSSAWGHGAGVKYTGWGPSFNDVKDEHEG